MKTCQTDNVFCWQIEKCTYVNQYHNYYLLPREKKGKGTDNSNRFELKSKMHRHSSQR
jgi:hypothetical protein